MKKPEKSPTVFKLGQLAEEDFPMDAFRYLSNPEVSKTIEKINEEYLYWDKVKYVTLPNVEGITHEKLWQAVKLKRNFGGVVLTFDKYQFGYLLTNHIAKSLHEFDMNFGGNINLEGSPESDKKQYLISSIMEEAIASSQIEGAVTTRKKAKEMLRKNLPPKNISEQMILNNYESIKHISTCKNKKITPELLLEIHKSITNKTLDNTEDEGKFRTNDDINVVDSADNEVVYIPPPHIEINDLIEMLCNFFNEEREDLYIHPIIKGCVIHFLIGWIHPFVDGNGRTARALFYWYLLRKGYWLIEYMSISRLIIKSKVQYARAYMLTENDNNDLNYFINYKINTLNQAFNGLLNYLQKKHKEKQQFKIIRQIGHINNRQAEIIRMINAEDIALTVKELEEIFMVSDQTIRNDLKGLVDRKIIKEIPLNNKSNIYGKGANFDSFITKSLEKNKNTLKLF